MSFDEKARSKVARLVAEQGTPRPKAKAENRTVNTSHAAEKGVSVASNSGTIHNHYYDTSGQKQPERRRDPRRRRTAEQRLSQQKKKSPADRSGDRRRHIRRKAEQVDAIFYRAVIVGSPIFLMIWAFLVG